MEPKAGAAGSEDPAVAATEPSPVAQVAGGRADTGPSPTAETRTSEPLEPRTQSGVPRALPPVRDGRY